MAVFSSCVWKVDLLDTHGSVILYEYVMTHLSTPDHANNPPPPCVWHYILPCFCADPLIHLSWGTDADCDLLLAAVTSQPLSRKRSIIYAQIGPILMPLFGRQLPKIAAAIAIVPLWNRWCYTWAYVCQILQSRLQVNASDSLQFLTHPTFRVVFVSLCRCFSFLWKTLLFVSWVSFGFHVALFTSTYSLFCLS